MTVHIIHSGRIGSGRSLNVMLACTWTRAPRSAAVTRVSSTTPGFQIRPSCKEGSSEMPGDGQRGDLLERGTNGEFGSDRREWVPVLIGKGLDELACRQIGRGSTGANSCAALVSVAEWSGSGATPATRSA